jgi:ABC-type antimicrobial peptide transport system permease subunit
VILRHRGAAVASGPPPNFGTFALVAIAAGVAAAVLPARRASRLNVLEALQYE